MLTREAILGADDLAQEQLLVPEWDGEVTVSAMDGMGRDAWEQVLLDQGAGTEERDIRGLKVELLIRSVRGEDGAPLFTSADREALLKKSGAAIDRVFQVAQRLNHLSDDQIEQLTENSSAGPNVDSGSA